METKNVVYMDEFFQKIHKNQSIFGLFGDIMGCTVYERASAGDHNICFLRKNSNF